MSKSEFSSLPSQRGYSVSSDEFPDTRWGFFLRLLFYFLPRETFRRLGARLCGLTADDTGQAYHKNDTDNTSDEHRHTPQVSTPPIGKIGADVQGKGENWTGN